jgi:hypothetical protein
VLVIGWLQPPTGFDAFGLDIVRAMLRVYVVAGGTGLALLAFALATWARRSIDVGRIALRGRGLCAAARFLASLFLLVPLPPAAASYAIDAYRDHRVKVLKAEGKAACDACRAYAYEHGRFPQDLSVITAPHAAERFVYVGAGHPPLMPGDVVTRTMLLFYGREEIPRRGRLVAFTDGRVEMGPDVWLRALLRETNTRRGTLGLPPL